MATNSQDSQDIHQNFLDIDVEGSDDGYQNKFDFNKFTFLPQVQTYDSNQENPVLDGLIDLQDVQIEDEDADQFYKVDLFKFASQSQKKLRNKLFYIDQNVVQLEESQVLNNANQLELFEQSTGRKDQSFSDSKKSLKLNYGFKDYLLSSNEKDGSLSSANKQSKNSISQKNQFQAYQANSALIESEIDQYKKSPKQNISQKHQNELAIVKRNAEKLRKESIMLQMSSMPDTKSVKAKVNSFNRNYSNPKFIPQPKSLTQSNQNKPYLKQAKFTQNPQPDLKICGDIQQSPKQIEKFMNQKHKPLKVLYNKMNGNVQNQSLSNLQAKYKKIQVQNLYRSSETLNELRERSNSQKSCHEKCKKESPTDFQKQKQLDQQNLKRQVKGIQPKTGQLHKNHSRLKICLDLNSTIGENKKERVPSTNSVKTTIKLEPSLFNSQNIIETKQPREQLIKQLKETRKTKHIQSQSQFNLPDFSVLSQDKQQNNDNFCQSMQNQLLTKRSELLSATDIKNTDFEPQQNKFQQQFQISSNKDQKTDQVVVQKQQQQQLDQTFKPEILKLNPVQALSSKQESVSQSNFFKSNLFIRLENSQNMPKNLPTSSNFREIDNARLEKAKFKCDQIGKEKLLVKSPSIASIQIQLIGNNQQSRQVNPNAGKIVKLSKIRSVPLLSNGSLNKIELTNIEEKISDFKRVITGLKNVMVIQCDSRQNTRIQCSSDQIEINYQ